MISKTSWPCCPAGPDEFDGCCGGEVELEGGEDVAAVDRHLVLASHQGGVHVGQLFFQLALQEEKMVGWRVHLGDGGSQELMGIILHSL